MEEEDAWGVLQGYLPDNREVGQEAVEALRQTLKDTSIAKEMEEEAAAVRRREAARAAALAAASSSDDGVQTGVEEEEELKREEDEEEEEVLTEAQLLDLDFLHDLLGEGGVEEEDERSGNIAAATTGKTSSLPSSSVSSSLSPSSNSVVAFPRDVIKYVYQVKCGKTRQRAAEVLVTSASEEGIASLRKEQVS